MWPLKFNIILSLCTYHADHDPFQPHNVSLALNVPVSGGIYPAKTRQQEQMLHLHVPKLTPGTCSDRIHSIRHWGGHMTSYFTRLSATLAYARLLYTQHSSSKVLFRNLRIPQVLFALPPAPNRACSPDVNYKVVTCYKSWFLSSAPCLHFSQRRIQ